MRPPAPPTLQLPSSRRRLGALGLSLALHALVLAALMTEPGRAWVRSLAPGAVDRLGGGGGGGDGGRAHLVAYISLPPASTSARTPVPVAVPRRRPVVTPQPTTPPAPAASQPPSAPRDTAAAPVASAAGAPAEGAGAGAGAGGGQGGGTGGGVGAGAGPATGGEGGRGAAPQPRQLVLPPADPPRSLRGRQVEVTFFVAADGRVERVALAPPIADGDFARKFDETMRNFRFRPARSPEGAPVPGSVTITVSF